MLWLKLGKWYYVINADIYLNVPSSLCNFDVIDFW